MYKLITPYIVQDEFENSSSESNWVLHNQTYNGGTLQINNGKMSLKTLGGSDGYMGKGDVIKYNANYPNLLSDFANYQIEFNMEEILREKTNNYKDNVQFALYIVDKNDEQKGFIISLHGNYSGYDPMQQVGYNIYNAHKMVIYANNATNWQSAFAIQDLDLAQYYNYDYKIYFSDNVWKIDYKLANQTTYTTVNTTFSQTTNLDIRLMISTGDGGVTRQNGKGTFNIDYFRIKQR